MRRNYEGLPAAANVEQAIILAQLLILKDLEKRAQAVQTDQALTDFIKKLAA